MQLLTTMFARAVIYPKVKWHELASHEDSAKASRGSGLFNELSIENHQDSSISATVNSAVRHPWPPAACRHYMQQPGEL
jgi:hypothetical protein